MPIKSKKDIGVFLNKTNFYFSYDSTGRKHYFVFQDRIRSGIWTIMLNENNSWSIHGKGDDYCDNVEKYLETDELVHFIWENRGAVNLSIKAVAVINNSTKP